MNSCFLENSYASCIITWSELFGFIFLLHLAMGIAQYYLTLKVKGESPKIALIPILSLYNLIKLSRVTISSLLVPIIFIILCGLGYFIRFLDDGIISLEKMYSFIIFNIGLSFWIIYLYIRIIKGVLVTAHYQGRFGVLLFLLFGPLFLIYLTLSYKDVSPSNAATLSTSPTGILENPAKSNIAVMGVEEPTRNSEHLTAIIEKSSSPAPVGGNSDTGKAVVSFIAIIAILGIIAFVIFSLFVLCILGGPDNCWIPGFWN